LQLISVFGGPYEGARVSQRHDQTEEGTVRKLPVWVEYSLGALGAIWLIGSSGYFFWTRLPYLNLLGKSLLGAWWFFTIIFVTNVLWPLTGPGQVRASDVENLWSFVRGAQPTNVPLRAPWSRLRRLLVLLFACMVLWCAYGVAGTLGLTQG
jgi:hypothetical protein